MSNQKNQDPVVTLTSFKHAEFASQETECFEAIVCVDGEKFCYASDEGCGGEMRLDPLKQGIKNETLMMLIWQVARRYNPNCVSNHNDAEKTECPNFDEWEAYHDKQMRSGKVTSYEVFQNLVSNALTREMYRKDLKKAMVKKVVWHDKSDDKIYNSGNAKNAAHRNALAERIAAKYPEATILNTMNKEAALDLFIEKVAS